MLTKQQLQNIILIKMRLMQFRTRAFNLRLAFSASSRGQVLPRQALLVVLPLIELFPPFSTKTHKFNYMQYCKGILEHFWAKMGKKVFFGSREIRTRIASFWLLLQGKMYWKLCTASHFQSKWCNGQCSSSLRLKCELKMSALRSYIRFL